MTTVDGAGRAKEDGRRGSRGQARMEWRGGRRKTAGEAAGGKQGWNGGRKDREEGRRGKQEGILIGG
jgi:hypothetical protein